MTVERGAKITIDLGDRQLYRAVQHAAIDLDESVREFVIRALRLRLERIEEEEDQAALVAAKAVLEDPTEEYVPLDQVKQELSV